MSSDQLSPRIHGGLSTAQKWENDVALLETIRAQIPFDELVPEQQFYNNKAKRNAKYTYQRSPYAKDDDDLFQGNDLLLKRFTRYYQKFMTWVNNPPCVICGCTETQCKGVRGPRSVEEKQGEAGRVEVYYCPRCDAVTTTFPRYNSPRKLLETRQGRCGEYANLFGCMLRAIGFEVRYISDFTDHVWVEVWSSRLERWIMADGCEGEIDKAAMYEKGWGKKLNYILAFTTDSVKKKKKP